MTLNRAVNQEMHLCKYAEQQWNRCIWSKISEYHLDLWMWLNWVQMCMPTGSRWASNNYITRWRISSSSSPSWSQLGDKMPVWESACRLRAWALSDPWLSSPVKMRKKCCYGHERNFGSICNSLSSSPTHLSHITNINPFATLLRIKCERYIFIKKCVRLFIEVVIIVWLCLCLHLDIYEYTTYIFMYLYVCVPAFI